MELEDNQNHIEEEQSCLMELETNMMDGLENAENNSQLQHASDCIENQQKKGENKIQEQKIHARNLSQKTHKSLINQTSTQLNSNYNYQQSTIIASVEQDRLNQQESRCNDDGSIYSFHSSSSFSSRQNSVKKRHKGSALSSSFEIESSDIGRRQVELKVQPIYKQIFPKSYVHIFGDMIIHTDINSLQDYIGINSPFNQIKRIQQIIYKKQQKTIEILFDNTNNRYIDFDNLIHLFSNYPDKTIHEFGKNLEKYKAYSIKQQKMIEICSKQEGFSEFTRLKQVKFERFKKKAAEVVDSYVNECICYIIYQRNYETGGLEMRSVGMNEKLILLLGTNMSDYEELVRRVGMYFFQNKYIYNYILSKYLQQIGAVISKHQSQPEDQIDSLQNQPLFKALTLQYQANMLTLDDYLIQSNTTIETYVDCSDEDADIRHDMLKFRDMVHIFRINISDETVQTLKKSRSTASSASKDIVLKESLYYELEASVFLEKFYTPKTVTQEEAKKKLQQEVKDQQNTCGYRVVNQ